jgi:hypothetical protein
MPLCTQKNLSDGSLLDHLSVGEEIALNRIIYV